MKNFGEIGYVVFYVFSNITIYYFIFNDHISHELILKLYFSNFHFFKNIINQKKFYPELIITTFNLLLFITN